jgi:hypothetical protein
MMGRETNDTFQEYATLFKFFDDLSEEASIPEEMNGFRPFCCMTNCDLSAQWKGLCKGGAAKVHTLPCTGCATVSDDLAKPNACACTTWCHEHALDPEWMCFHKPMATPERIDLMRAEVEFLVSTLEGDLQEIQKESKMTHFDVDHQAPTASSMTDAFSIHFMPENNHQKQAFSCLLTDELILRGLDTDGSLQTRRELLQEALKGESMITSLSKEIAHGDAKEGAYFLLMQTLPCVLHMENRNGIKLLTMVLIEGLSNVNGKILYPDINSEGKRVSRFISDIENIINKRILGTEDDPCQWMCPMDSTKKKWSNYDGQCAHKTYY